MSLYLKRFVPLVLVAGVLAGTRSEIEPSGVSSDSVAFALALRKLGVVSTFMLATAHPDDENNALLVMLSRGQGLRTILATATRGDGGQNEIGPELFDALAVLRTEELLAVHRIDGAEQYFTRAVDFGYSFSIEETLERWGRDEIVSDFVRLIRMTRPDVVMSLRPGGAGGGQHHQAAARLARQAFQEAGDPGRSSEQIREGLRPWQPKKMYFYAPGGGRAETSLIDPSTRSTSSGSTVSRVEPSIVELDVGGFDPLLGRTYAEVGSQARSMHKCQGTAQLLALPGPARGRYQLVDSLIETRAEQSLFDGLDVTVRSLAAHVRPQAPPFLVSGLDLIARYAEQARSSFQLEEPDSAASAVMKGLAAVRDLRSRIHSANLDPDARFEIDFRLQQEEHDFQEAALLAYGLRVEAFSSAGLVVGGQRLRVQTIVANGNTADGFVKELSFEGLEGETRGCAPGPLKRGEVFGCAVEVDVPLGSKLTEPYWRGVPGVERYEFEPGVPFGAPFAPTPFRAKFVIELPGGTIGVERPILHRYEGDVFSGEKRMEIHVVPALSVRLTPEILIIPRAAAARDREIRVSVTNGSPGPLQAEVSLKVSNGWRVVPEVEKIAFSRQGESTLVRFRLTAPPSVGVRQIPIEALVMSGGTRFDRGYQVVEYPHIQRRHVYDPAVTSAKVIDLSVASPLRVGYIMGVGDQVPDAIRQLGVTLDLLGGDDLAWGDLARYDTIMTGVRAYERRDDLRASNDRLLEYVRKGGTLIVQYNKFEFNAARYGPYPVKVSSSRVTDESAPVEILRPEHPVFNWPNRIGDSAWKGWVQERGLYFLGDRDERYVDLLQLYEPFEFNRGWKQGALVEAQYGSGRWLYLGLGLWRQLPAGTDGAYQLLANLLSLGKNGGRKED